MPMISLRDWVGGVVHLAEHDAVSGPVNLICPQPPTNAEFTEELAEQLHAAVVRARCRRSRSRSAPAGWPPRSSARSTSARPCSRPPATSSRTATSPTVLRAGLSRLTDADQPLAADQPQRRPGARAVVPSAAAAPSPVPTRRRPRGPRRSSTQRSVDRVQLAQREHLDPEAGDDQVRGRPTAAASRRPAARRPTRTCRATAGGVRRRRPRPRTARRPRRASTSRVDRSAWAPGRSRHATPGTGRASSEVTSSNQTTCTPRPVLPAW